MSRIDDLIAQLCPEGVQFVALADAAETVSGLTGKTKADFTDGNARFVPYKNVFANLAVDQADLDFVKVRPGERQNSLHLGDVVFTGSSENLEEVGMSAAVLTEPTKPLYLNSFCFALRFHDTDLLDPGFSKYLFRGTSVRSAIQKSASGVTRINISKQRFMKIRVPIPPVEVQREIVRTLDLFTSLEAALEAELEKRRQQYVHYQRSLLSFAEGQARWMTLGDIGRVAMCKRIFKSETAATGEIPFYKIGTFGGIPDAFISRNIYEDYRARYSFPKAGDVLISAAGTIGRTIPYDGKPAYFQDSNIVWLDNDESIVSNAYLRYWYRVITWSTDGGTIRRLYNDNIRRARIAVPPPDEQARIVETLDKFDALTSDLSSGLPAEINARRQQFEYYRDRLLTFDEAVA